MLNDDLKDWSGDEDEMEEMTEGEAEEHNYQQSERQRRLEQNWDW